MSSSNGNFSLFIDTDDVLIFSSEEIEKQVNEKTCFKTITLRMYEQLIRNCKYFYDEVKKEVERSLANKRLPNFSRFPILRDYYLGIDKNMDFFSINYTDLNHIYNNSVNLAKYYVDIAKEIFNQHLEERDMFLEKDNLPIGTTKGYDFYKEMTVKKHFMDLLTNNRDSLIEINHFCLDEIKRITKDAKEKGIVPQYGELIKIDNNDIIRTNTIDKTFDHNRLLYEKPIEDVNLTILYEDRLDDIIVNFDEMFKPSKNLIDYDSIYVKDKVNQEALSSIKYLIANGDISEVYNITHHNGEREEKAKKSFIKSILPEATFIGMRFHNTEHNMKRRGRSSKMLHCSYICNMPKCRMILLDDSIDNCSDWENRDGKAILYRKLTDAELIKGEQEVNLTRIKRFDGQELVDLVNEYKKDLPKQKTL